MPLAEQRAEQPREEGWRAWADVWGGVSFAVFVGLFVVQGGSMIFDGAGWGARIGWETVWLIASLVCAQVLPLGIRPVTDALSSLKGFALDWPEVVISTKFVLAVAATAPLATALGPLGLALAVGAAEEMIFRVIVLGWLVTRLPVDKALLVSAAVFAFAHFQEFSLVGLMSITPQFAGGMLLGAMYLRTNNIIGSIGAHALWDFPIFWAFGLGISGGSTEGGMPSMGFSNEGLWDFWMWLGLSIYGLWLIRPGVHVPVRDEPHAPLVTHPAGA